jgi:putative membrane protein
MHLLAKQSQEKKKSGSKNSSLVREHLANERTYLAWMRTAISLLGFGVVIVKLRMLQAAPISYLGTTWKLGLLFSVVGLVTVWLSTIQYFSIRRNIESETYEPSSRWVILFSLAIIVLGSGVVYFVFMI